MKSSRYSRRTFLAGVGLGPGLLPLLTTDRAEAGCLANPPRRVITVVWTNGVLEWTGGSGADYTLPAYLKALEPHKADIIPIKGVRLQNLKDTPNPQRADSAGHGATPAILTGRIYKELRPFVEIAGGPSLDQYIAAELVKKGVKTPRAALTLGVMQQGYLATWRNAGEPARPDNDPYHVFDGIFAGQAGVGPDPAIERIRAARKSVMDLVRRDLDGFRANVGKENRLRIDSHLTSIRELETNMSPGGIVNPDGCAPPKLGDKIDFKNTRNFHTTLKLQMDLAVAALAADVTRVVSLQLGNEGDNHIIPTWLGIQPTGKSGGLGDDNSHHSIAHRGGDTKRRVDGWFHEMFAYLIGKLKTEKDGNGKPMLDSTVILFANHMAHGGSHSTDNIPFLLAGRGGGYFKTGQSVSVPNVMHTAVLKEIGLAMGVDMKPFFEAKYDTELPALRA